MTKVLSESHKRNIGLGVRKSLKENGGRNNHPCYLPHDHPRRIKWIEKSRRKQIGIIPTKKTRTKMSISHTGHLTRQKTRDAIGKANSGHEVSPNQIKKQKESLEVWFQSREGQKWRKDQSKRRTKQVFPKKDSLPERILQKSLIKLGIRFEKHIPVIGQPDLFIQPNLCIFADGDYWHSPEERPIQKLKDKKISYSLKKRGYRVIRLREFDIHENPTLCVEKIIKEIEKLKIKK